MDSFADDIAAISRIDMVPKILEVVCRTTGMGFAAVARVTEDRWIACAVRDEIDFGLTPGGELEVKTTICDEIRDNGRSVLIDHVAEDPLFRDHPTPRMYGFQSYVSVPIRRNGVFFGTLCAIDPRPMPVKPTESMFELFADLIARHLEAQDELAVSHAALLDEREAAELREQFIAVLGHDLRNPLAAVDAGARLLRKTPLNDKAVTLVDAIQGSVQRMAGLLDDVLDFARGRLGGGIEIGLQVDPKLDATLRHVIAELSAARPHREIVVEMALDEPVACDGRRIGQMLSNLLANALTHGAVDRPVIVKAQTQDGVFELSVSNSGAAIPEATRQKLFNPFTRASAAPHQQGLGLGLYIVREIAHAHGGEIGVTSDAENTTFAFRMPNRAAIS